MAKITIAKKPATVAQAMAGAMKRPIVPQRPVVAGPRETEIAKLAAQQNFDAARTARRPTAPAPTPEAIASAPAKRGRPSNAEIAARAATQGATVVVHAAGAASPLRPGNYTNDGKGNLVPLVRTPATANTTNNAEFVKAIEELKATVQAQSETIAKLKAKASNVRALSDVVDGADNGLDGDDWRVAGNYNGATIRLRQYTRDKAQNIVVDEGLPTVPVLLAIPRMTDFGDHGTEARTFGQIATYFVREDGQLEGPEDYLYERDLAAAWAD